MFIGIPMNSSPVSITLDLLSGAESSYSECVVEPLLETFDEECDSIFFFRLERFFFLLFF